MGSVDACPALSYLEGKPLDPEEQGQHLAGWQHVLNSASRYPDNIALVSMHQPASLYSTHSTSSPEYVTTEPTYLRWTYRILMEAIGRMLSAFRSRNIGPGTVVVTFVPNGAEYVISIVAAHLMGCIFAPLNPRSLVNKDEVNHILGLFSFYAPGNKFVVVAEDASVAQQIDNLGFQGLKDATKIVISGPLGGEDTASQSGHWIPFSDLMMPAPGEPSSSDITSKMPLTPLDFPHATDDTLFCTSGTTSRPKVCAWTRTQVSYHTHVLSQENYSSNDKILCVAPINHIAGNESLNEALNFGGTVIFPSARFEPEPFVRALHLEKPTSTLLVPAMVLALGRGKMGKIASLRTMAVGGSPICPEVLRLAVDVFGCQKFSPLFGCTEGAVLRAGERTVEELLGSTGTEKKDMDDSAVPTTWGVLPGEAAKICEPGKGGAVLPLGTVGELHISSPGSCAGYVGVPAKEASSFYHDSTGRAWYNTGDQAWMDELGRLYVMGRYKDMIIRGGENIAPAAMEAVLEPTLGHLGIQIVGAPDYEGVAGEVVVVVTEKKVDSDTVVTIGETIARIMGPAYVPDQVISLHDVGLREYPRTSVGKIQKNKVAAAVRRYREAQMMSTQNDKVDALPQQEEKDIRTLYEVRRVWSNAIGIFDDEKLLSPGTEVSSLPIDSIAMMRVRDRLAKALQGRTLSLAEISHTKTLREQAALLDAMKPVSQGDIAVSAIGNTNTEDSRASGPPEIDDMMHLIDNPSLFDATKEVVDSAINRCGLSWEKDVRAVIPATDWNSVSFDRLGGSTLFDTNMKMVLAAKNKTPKDQLRNALRRVMDNNPLMASFIVSDRAKLGNEQALHVVVDLDSVGFLDGHVFIDGGKIATTTDLVEFAKKLHVPGRQNTAHTGPTTKLWLFDVEETGSSAVVFDASHSVFDATFSNLVYEDLDAALTHPNVSLKPHTSYKIWADSLFNLRSSPAAQAAVKYHAKALRGLGTHRNAIWPSHPPAYAPRFLTLPEDGKEGVVHVFDVPGWSALRGKHGDISSPILLKGALSLFLMKQTGHRHAMFGHVESERAHFPFLPKSVGDVTASDVGGITMQTVVNLVSATLPDETVLAFLRRMQTTQTLQTKHASAPRMILNDALDAECPGTSDLANWVLQATLFNWLGAMQLSSQDQYKSFEIAHVVIDRQVFGFAVMAGMFLLPPQADGTPGGVKIWIKLLGTRFGEAELREFARQLEELTKWMISEENWNRGVDQFVEVR